MTRSIVHMLIATFVNKGTPIVIAPPGALATGGGRVVGDEDKSHYCNPRKDLIFRSSFE